MPSLIGWQIRCLAVIPVGEGLHLGSIVFAGRTSLTETIHALVWNTIELSGSLVEPTLTGGYNFRGLGEYRGRPHSPKQSTPEAVGNAVQN